MLNNPKPTKHYIAATDGLYWRVVEEISGELWCMTRNRFKAEHTAALLNAEIEATRALPKFLDLNIARVTNAAKA